MKKARKIALATVAFGTSAALLVGGAVAAQADDKGKGGGVRGPLSTLVTDGTLTTAQVTAIHDALKAERAASKADHQAEMKAERAAVLADLVAKGTITKAQADAISAADRGGMRDLVSDGTVTRDDLSAIHDALKADREDNKAEHHAEMKADRAAVLADLVADGTLTQAEADAVQAAFDAMPGRGDKRGPGGKGGHGGKGGERGERGERGQGDMGTARA